VIRRLRTVDAHAAGEPLRLIVDGFPAPAGRTMLEKREWVRKKKDHLRRALMLEPRGHADMSGALLTEPVSPGSHAGLLFMDTGGYAMMSGHGVIAATTIALERGLLMPGGDGTTIVYDTPAGTIRAVATLAPGHGGERTRASGSVSPPRDQCRVERVAFVNVPSFVLHPGLVVKLGARRVPVDVAFGGAFYAIVDCEAVGLPLAPSHLPELRRVGTAVKDAIEAGWDIVHPLDPAFTGIAGTIFTGPPHQAGADLRTVTVSADAQIDRSPCGTGTAAIMAVLDVMGLLGEDRPFVPESIVGTRVEGRICRREMVADAGAIVIEIAGAAWITGDHTFQIDDADPLKDGFRIA
jgi:trans-L-3-hydroxyproline dehydratase